MSREAVRVEHDGASRLVWPCSVPGCNNLCDLDYDSLFVCNGHLAMIPSDMLACIDGVMVEAMDGIVPHSSVQEIFDDVLVYVIAADAVINGDGLA